MKGVTIIIPVYNRAKIVGETLKSVVSQSYRPLQIVLVDNNSTDDTGIVLKAFKNENEMPDFKVDVIVETSPGACAARNSGARLAQYEWLMFFDSDDTMDVYLVENYVRKIEDSNEQVDVVTINANFEKDGECFQAFFAKKDFMVNHVFHSCLSTQRYIIRKSIYDKTGGWNKSVMCWNDWELGIRILLQEPRIKVLDRVLVHVRVHRDSITGLNYSDNHERREYAVNEAIKAVEESEYKCKSRVIRMLKARRFVLAGLYKKEGNKALAESYYCVAIRDVVDDKILRLLAPIIYRYVGIGGRGIDRLIKISVR